MSARKAIKAVAKPKTTDLTKKRSIKFSQRETDLLCTLVVSSDVLSNVTNKITTFGRLACWEDIATVFNASPGVSVSNSF